MDEGGRTLGDEGQQVKKDAGLMMDRKVHG